MLGSTRSSITAKTMFHWRRVVVQIRVMRSQRLEQDQAGRSSIVVE
jgi:hypothetical protein